MFSLFSLALKDQLLKFVVRKADLHGVELNYELLTTLLNAQELTWNRAVEVLERISQEWGEFEDPSRAVKDRGKKY
jgi:hypothetical protein